MIVFTKSPSTLALVHPPCSWPYDTDSAVQVATGQYGVDAVACPGSASDDVKFQPVMFWSEYYHVSFLDMF